MDLSQNDFELFLISELSRNKFFLQFLFNLITKYCCFLYFIKSSTDLELFALSFKLKRLIMAFVKVLLI